MNKRPASSCSRHSITGQVFVTAMCLATIARAEPPAPPSPVIREFVWAPADTIIRRAAGSDEADRAHLTGWDPNNAPSFQWRISGE